MTVEEIIATWKKFADGNYDKQFGSSQKAAEFFGKRLGELLSENAVSLDDYEKISEVMFATIGKNAQTLERLYNQRQAEQDKADNVKIKPAQAEFPKAEIGAKASEISKLSEESRAVGLQNSAEDLTLRCHDNIVKANADSRVKKGFKATAERVAEAGACPYCVALAGVYEYPHGIPTDFFRRHDCCKCEIKVITEKGSDGAVPAWESMQEKERMKKQSEDSAPKVLDEKTAPKKEQQKPDVEHLKALSEERKPHILSGENSENGVDKSGESGIIEENRYSDSANNFIKITDETISFIPDFTEFESKELNQAVHNACQDILRDLKDAELGTEKIVIINTKTLETKSLIGELGAVKKISFDVPFISVHNHPSGETFSIKDLDIFATNQNIRAICVVGNNAKTYMLLKNENYNSADFSKCYLSYLLGLKQYDNIEYLFEEVKQYGVQYIKK